MSLNELNVDSLVTDGDGVLRTMVRVFSYRSEGLKICHINAQSLMPKIDEFRDIFGCSKVDVICVSETWFSPYVNDKTYELNGYRLFRSDRCHRSGGGVAIYVREGLVCKRKYASPFGCNLEYLFVDIICHESRLLLGTVYRPNKYVDLTPFSEVMEEISTSSDNVIICGDFNSNLLVERQLSESMCSFDLHPVNTTVPTHFSGSSSTLLDVFFVNDANSVLFYDQLSAPVFSRHDLIFLTYDFNIESRSLIETYQFRDFRSINRFHLERHFNCIPWEFVYDMSSPEDQVEFLHKNINLLFDSHVPIKTRTVSQRSKSWFSREIRELMMQRDEAYRRWKRFRIDELHQAYKSLRNNVVRQIRVAKTQVFSARLNTNLGGRRLWNNLRDLGIGRQRPNYPNNINCSELNRKFLSLPYPVATIPNINFDDRPALTNGTSFGFINVDNMDVVECFLSVKSNAVGVDGVHPVFIKSILPLLLPYITHIFNTVLTTGFFPRQWKMAKIIPIPKNSTCDEFRPISILPFLSKVCERIMQKQLNAFLGNNNLLTQVQSGFRSKHSCTTALIKVVEDIRSSLDEGSVTFLVLLDFSKAFDMVNHSHLINKLHRFYNISPSATNLIFSYLSGRKQAVSLDNVLSEFLDLQRGVPQGSILGPLLFSLYINEIPNIVQHSSTHIYADDVQIYQSCPLGLIDNCAHNINLDLERILNWSIKYGLTLNPNKCKCLVISKTILDLSYFPPVTLNNLPIEFVNSSRNLGVVFNRTLTWNDHISSIVGRAYGALRTLWTAQQFTPVNTRVILARSLVIPVLVYGCEIFLNCDAVSKRKLRVAFNSTIRYIYGLRRYDHVSHLSKILLDMSFDCYIKFRTLILLFDILKTHQPPYLYSKLQFPASNRSTCLILPRFTCLTSERQFFISAIRLWNSLPNYLRVLNDRQRFKKELQFFFANQSN